MEFTRGTRSDAEEAAQCKDRSVNGLEALCPDISRTSRSSFPVHPFCSRSQFLGLMSWPCAMGMWFLYMNQHGLGFYDVILTYNKWADGWQGFTIDQLTSFVNQGQCV